MRCDKRQNTVSKDTIVLNTRQQRCYRKCVHANMQLVPDKEQVVVIDYMVSLTAYSCFEATKSNHNHALDKSMIRNTLVCINYSEQLLHSKFFLWLATYNVSSSLSNTTLIIRTVL